MNELAVQMAEPETMIPADSEPFGRFENVQMVFERSRQDPLVAIEDISFDIDAGQLISLLGPSGCGKTTFLRIAAGLTRATGGVVRIRGVDVTKPQDDFGFVFQSPNLMPWRNVLDNVLFPMEVKRRRNAAAKARAAELLELVGLAGFEKVRPAELSGGMQQRAALCRALIHEPSLLLMDEPFGALDELTRMEMNDLLLEIRQVTGATTLFVTHSISEAIYLSDRVVVFSKRPANIADLLEIDMVYPRSAELRYVPEFTEFEHRASIALGISR
ncbi:MAG TPA: ABC transporter ATP-binding protein [Alphaproteobacteria bacterium]|nr:ABC transporter ATP-binding protein [Alphaproteobacteria bacterium]